MFTDCFRYLVFTACFRYLNVYRLFLLPCCLLTVLATCSFLIGLFTLFFTDCFRSFDLCCLFLLFALSLNLFRCFTFPHHLSPPTTVLPPARTPPGVLCVMCIMRGIITRYVCTSGSGSVKGIGVRVGGNPPSKYESIAHNRCKTCYSFKRCL